MQSKNQIRKVYQIGNSAVVAIAPAILKKLNMNLNDSIFVEESVTESGEILLRIRRLQ
jgi:antitoxin component of MazEF toxin-antitoxin module